MQRCCSCEAITKAPCFFGTKSEAPYASHDHMIWRRLFNIRVVLPSLSSIYQLAQTTLLTSSHGLARGSIQTLIGSDQGYNSGRLAYFRHHQSRKAVLYQPAFHIRKHTSCDPGHIAEAAPSVHMMHIRHRRSFLPFDCSVRHPRLRGGQPIDRANC